MKTRGILIGYILMLGLILYTFDATRTLAATAPEFIKIGCTLPLTGRFASSGIECKDGYEIGVDHINQAGGIFIKEFGKRIPVQLFLYDDESDPVKAAARYEKLHTLEKVDVYLGSFSTIINASLIAVAEKHRVPIVVSFFSVMEPHRRGYKYMFSPFFKAPEILVLFSVLNDFFGKEPPKRVAIAVSRTEMPMEFANVYRTHIQKEGYYKLLVDETYPLGATDFSMIISKAKAADVEVFLSVPTPPEGMAMLRQMKELDYCPKFMDLSQAVSSRGWPGGSGEIGEYATGVTGWDHTLTWPGCKRLVEDSKKRLGGKVPWANIGHAYIDVQVLADAIERAGTLDRGKIRDALAKTEMMTVGGPVKACPDGTFGAICYLSQWQKGQFVAVAPKKYTTVAPIFPIPKWDKR